MVGVGEDQPFGRSIDISSDPTTVRNNVLNTMGDGIYVSNSTEHTIAGNKIGVAVNGSAGTSLGNSGKGILLYAVTNTTVGGSVTADRNIISNNGVDGIRLEANSSGNSIAGNYIGVLADGITSAGNNETGIMLENGSSNTIGGSLAERNVIANNGSDGIRLEAGTTDTIIESNIIYNNAVAGSAGVNVYQAPNTTIGSPGRGNIVYSNHGVGISISSAPSSKIQANI
jgi:parallel beta-helix repeat protein